MKHLLSSWEELEPSIQEQTVLLFLEYDGTLVPRTGSSSHVKMSPTTKKILRTLLSLGGVKTAVVSSRPLAELKRRVGISGLIYVASHGLEIEEPTLRFIHPHAASAKKLMEKLRERLKKTMKAFPLVHVEDRTFSLSVHYGRLAQDKIDRARAVFFRTVRPYLGSSQIIVKEGRKAWEVRPAARWNKGTTIVWFYGKVLAHSSGKVLPIYLGGDSVDEDAFYSIKPLGIGVKMIEQAEEGSAASHFLRSPKEVLAFLKQVVSAKHAFEKAAVRQKKRIPMAEAPAGSQV